MNDPNPTAPSGEHREVPPHRLATLEATARAFIASASVLGIEDTLNPQLEDMLDLLALISTYRTRPNAAGLVPQAVGEDDEERELTNQALDATVAGALANVSPLTELQVANAQTVLVAALLPVVYGYVSATRQARKAEMQATAEMAYWYRRCEKAEVALEPFADCVDKFDNGAISSPLWMIGLHDYRNAHRVLEERRQGGIENLEDYVRDNRQDRMLEWGHRVFGKQDGRTLALRFLEAALKLYYAAYPLTASPSDYKPMTDATLLAEHVRLKMPDKPAEEIGSVCLTLNLLAGGQGLKVAHWEQAEFAHVLTVPLEYWKPREAEKRAAGF